MTNLTSAAIVTAAQCSAACCAATSFTCTTATWHAADATCLGGDVNKQPSCPRDNAWTSFLVNYVPKPPPPPPPIPFGFAKVHGDGMVLAAAPKPAMVWGFCDPGAAVTVSLDGAAAIKATIGPDQATGALTTWRVLLPATAAGFTNHTIAATSAGKTVTLSGVLFGEVCTVYGVRCAVRGVRRMVVYGVR